MPDVSSQDRTDANHVLASLDESAAFGSLMWRTGYKGVVALTDQLALKKSGDAKANATGSKELLVLNLLRSLDIRESTKQVLPKPIAEILAPSGNTWIVITRLPGLPAKDASRRAADIIEAMSDIHSRAVGLRQGIDEFEGLGSSSLIDHLQRGAEKFERQLEGRVAAEDATLIAEAFSRLRKIPRSNLDELPNTLIHKDLYDGNILFDSVGLTGILDWEAAQTAPREWEWAVWRIRYPKHWSIAIRKEFAKPTPLDTKVLDYFTLYQALRFWKSFPDHDLFVNQQRRAVISVMKESTSG